MLLARWESNIIMRYVAEAPLNAMTQEYKNLQSHKDLTEQLKKIDMDCAQQLHIIPERTIEPIVVIKHIQLAEGLCTRCEPYIAILSLLRFPR